MTDEQILEFARKWGLFAAGLPQIKGFALDCAAAGASEGQEPVAWLHTMHMEGGQTDERLSFSDQNPWGEPGLNYSEEYAVVSKPLAHPSAEIAALRERIAGMEKDAAWISVDERLPTNDQIVAFVVKADRESPNWYLNGHVLGGTYHESWGFSTPGVGHRASHWMPLPAAPASSVASKEDQQ